MSSTPAILSAPIRTDILVLRHAEVHNPTDIVYGRLPRFGLSRRGREQAELAARFISTSSPAVIYTSPLLRARQTAAIVSQHASGLPIRTARTLIEVRTSYQGQPNSILKPGFSFYDPVSAVDDERMDDVRTRMLAFLHMAIRRHPGKTVIAVSHGDPIAIMRLGVEGRELNARTLHTTVYPARASITRIVVDSSQALKLAYFDIVGDGPT